MNETHLLSSRSEEKGAVQFLGDRRRTVIRASADLHVGASFPKSRRHSNGTMLVDGGNSFGLSICLSGDGLLNWSRAPRDRMDPWHDAIADEVGNDRICAGSSCPPLTGAGRDCARRLGVPQALCLVSRGVGARPSLVISA